MTNNNYFMGTNAELGTGILIFELLNIVDPPAASVVEKSAIKARARLNPEDLGGQ